MLWRLPVADIAVLLRGGAELGPRVLDADSTSTGAGFSEYELVQVAGIGCVYDAYECAAGKANKGDEDNERRVAVSRDPEGRHNNTCQIGRRDYHVESAQTVTKPARKNYADDAVEMRLVRDDVSFPCRVTYLSALRMASK